MAEVQCVVEAKDILGEGPIWHPGEQALYWTDINAPAIQRFDPATGAVTRWPMPEQVGSFVFREQGGIVAGMKSGFAFIDLHSNSAQPYSRVEPNSTARHGNTAEPNGRAQPYSRVEPIALAEPIYSVEPDLPHTRLNDGKCDRAGRYWCGTVDDERKPHCGLYRLDPGGSVRKMDGGFTVANGIAWSPDNRTMYFSDSPSETVYAYDFDLASGEIANRREFISTKGMDAFVDGATVDAEGFYWCAHIYAGEIARYDPHGKLERTIELPVRHPTMCTFGGKDLDTLYVTSGTQFVKEKWAHTQPLAGGLFAIHNVGVRGLPEPFFAG